MTRRLRLSMEPNGTIRYRSPQGRGRIVPNEAGYSVYLNYDREPRGTWLTLEEALRHGTRATRSSEELHKRRVQRVKRDPKRRARVLARIRAVKDPERRAHLARHWRLPLKA